MMNRRGDVAITLLVFMIVVLLGYSLFSFYKGASGVGVEVTDSRFVEGMYLNEGVALFNIESAGEKALVKGYRETLNEGVFRKIGAGTANSEVDGLMRDRVLDALKKEPAVGKYVGAGDNLVVVVNGEDIEIDAKNVILPTITAKGKEEKVVGVGVYEAKPNITMNLREQGLWGFVEIVSVSRECVKDNKDLPGSAEAEIERCVEARITTFDVRVSKEGANFVLNFISKKTFYLDKQFKKVDFAFKVGENGEIA